MKKDLKNLFGKDHGLDEKSVSFLVSALERSNLQGFDYIEFKLSLAALAEMNMDEATSLKSAFATASTMGWTKDKLLKTAEHYKNVLNSEKKQFDAALQNQIKKNVQSKLGEVEKLKKQVEAYKLKIKELEEKITKSQHIISTADEEVRAAKEKIVNTKEGFESTLQSILNDIDNDIENIKNHL